VEKYLQRKSECVVECWTGWANKSSYSLKATKLLEWGGGGWGGGGVILLHIPTSKRKELAKKELEARQFRKLGRGPCGKGKV